MGNTIKFLDSNSFGNETYFDPKGEYTGNSLRFNSDLVSTPYGKINAKPLFNTDAKKEISPQLRLTTSSPDLKLGSLGGTNFKANLENRTTFKFNKNFETQDIANSARINLKAQNGDYSAYSAFKLDCSQNKPDLKFAGTTLGVQKNFGKKFSAYVEGYLPKESFQGNIRNTSYAIGMAVKF